MLTYTSQCPEFPKIFDKHFGDKPGYFAEIGAYNGKDFGFTWELASLGWKGVCVEPNPLSFQKLQDYYRYHPGVTCLQVAVGLKKVYQLILNGPYTTTREDIHLIHTRNGWVTDSSSRGTQSVIGMTLDEVLISTKSPRDFELLVIDVEGAELEVLQSFTISNWLPKMVVVEANQDHPIVELRVETQAINDYMIAAGYEVIYTDFINNIYLRTKTLSGK